jgi:hypothetical protein
MNRGALRLGAWIVSAFAAVSAPAWALPPRPAQDAQAVTEKDKASEIGTITITLSGVGRRNKTTVIRYRKSDLSIVGVVENGRDVPPEKFDRYQEELRRALEYPRTRDLLGRMEDLTKSIKRMGPLNHEQRLELDKLLADINSLIPKLSPDKKPILEPLYFQMFHKIFETTVLVLLRERKFVAPDEEVRLVMRKSKCEVNGREIPPDLSDEILRLWEKCEGTPLQASERVTIIFGSKKDAEIPRRPL